MDVSDRRVVADVSCGRVGGCPQALGRWRKGGGGGVSGECHADLGSLSESVSEVSRKCLGSGLGKCLGSVSEVSHAEVRVEGAKYDAEARRRRAVRHLA